MGCIPHNKNRHISTFGKSVPCRDESVTPVISAAADDDHPRVFPGYFFFHTLHHGSAGVFHKHRLRQPVFRHGALIQKS